ncbi:hypothetical protein FO519_005670 [Halicephalobus sp. NKZ332]|nr:hypothetical protein FO519_005670 [Halicephalobus sp. NKZ332]
MGILWIPVPLFPAMASYIRGPLVILGTSGAHIIMCILSGSAVCIANCLLTSLIYRYSTVAKLRVYHLMSHKRIIPIIVGTNFFCFFSGFGINFFANVPFNTLKNITLKNYPEFREIFEGEVVFGYTVEANNFIIVYGGFSLFFFGTFAIVAVILIWLLMKSLYAQKSLMSKQKFNFQLSLFMALSIQFAIPFLFGVLPISIVTVLVQLHVPNVTSICEFCLFCGCLHTVLSNLTNIVIVKPYRNAALFYLGHSLFLLTGRKIFSAQFPDFYSGSKSKTKAGSVFITSTVQQRTRVNSIVTGRVQESRISPVHITINQRTNLDSAVTQKMKPDPTVPVNIQKSQASPIHHTVPQKAKSDFTVIGKLQDSDINSIHPIVGQRLKFNSTVTGRLQESELNSIHPTVMRRSSESGVDFTHPFNILGVVSKFKSLKINNVISIQ